MSKHKDNPKKRIVETKHVVCFNYPFSLCAVTDKYEWAFRFCISFGIVSQHSNGCIFSILHENMNENLFIK